MVSISCHYVNIYTEKVRALEAIMDESVPKRGRRMAEEGAAVPALVGSVRSIPDDIFLFHILILLPVKSLVRFQSVCKLWRATITSAPFVRRHLEVSRATRPSSMALVPRKSPKDPTKTGAAGVNIFRFEPGQSKVAELMLEKEVASGVPVFSIPLHCDGLVLIPCTTGQVFVCNPATGEFVELPPLTHVASLEHRAAFAFDPWSGTYKVGRPFIRSYRETEIDGQSIITEYSIGHEILTIGDPSGTWNWKETMDPPYPIKPRTPICLPGVFYWSGVKSKGWHGHTTDTDVILRFSLQDERFTVHPNPPCSDFLSIFDWLCELGGKLCYLQSSQFDVDIWLAKDGPNLTWSLWCSFNLPVPRCLHVLACVSADKEKIFLSVDSCYLLIGDLRKGSLVEMIDMAYEVVYDDRNGSRFTTVGLHISHFMVPFVESLLRIRP
jgi:F-box interacting protein